MGTPGQSGVSGQSSRPTCHTSQRPHCPGRVDLLVDLVDVAVAESRRDGRAGGVALVHADLHRVDVVQMGERGGGERPRRHGGVAVVGGVGPDPVADLHGGRAAPSVDPDGAHDAVVGRLDHHELPVLPGVEPRLTLGQQRDVALHGRLLLGPRHPGP